MTRRIFIYVDYQERKLYVSPTLSLPKISFQPRRWMYRNFRSCTPMN